ncbi:SubName: Full=Uncharacterized protein {ECO:0000313/EMBL:CCA71950.1} [Serendipita indica DSM 11827]|nr:SubName: Full=Uncharacterized protein {ECO:0000313/EMBL:CCA71950.1} [Serendipita indica DSM 11827]
MAAALMQAYSAMNGWMNEEGIVNGMWTAFVSPSMSSLLHVNPDLYSILNELFPQNTLNFLIGPEVHSANNTNRADLSIYESTPRRDSATIREKWLLSTKARGQALRTVGMIFSPNATTGREGNQRTCLPSANAVGILVQREDTPNFGFASA